MWTARRIWRFLVEASNVWMVFLAVMSLGASGLMGYFTSLEGAPWPVVILVVSTVCALTGTGLVAAGYAVRRWWPHDEESHEEEHLVARANVRLTERGPEFKRTDNLTSVSDDGNGLITINWFRGFDHDEYDVTVTPTGCDAHVETIARGFVSIRVSNYRGPGTPEIRIKAEGEAGPLPTFPTDLVPVNIEPPFVPRGLADQVRDLRREQERESFPILQGDLGTREYTRHEIDRLTENDRERLFERRPEMREWYYGRARDGSAWNAYRLPGGQWLTREDLDAMPQEKRLELLHAYRGLAEWGIGDRPF